MNARIAHGGGNLADGQARFAQQVPGNPQSFADEELLRRLSPNLPEKPREMVKAVVGLPSQIRRAAGREWVGLHVGHDLLDRRQPTMRTGGVVFALDHRIPDGTPVENYRYYADLGREILGLPPRPAKPTAFHRSA